MILYVLYLLLIPLYGCINLFTSYDTYGDDVDRFISKEAAVVCKKYHINLCERGRGNASGAQTARKISVGFNYFGQPVTLEQGRKLLVTITEELLEAINGEETIRPLLAQFPFTMDNLDTSIILYDPHGDTYQPPHLCTIFTVNDQIGYFTRDPESPLRYKTEVYRPYAEELAIVQADPLDGFPPFVE